MGATVGPARFGDRPLVVGIVNCTPDSFYDGGRHLDPVAHALSLVQEGADWIDVGGESTRPGASPVDADAEWGRIRCVVEALAGEVPVSVDTSKPAVAARALKAGARILNDVRALADPEMIPLTADFEATVVMHSRGTPANMSGLTSYGDLVDEVAQFLAERASLVRSATAWIDPGIGFAKTAEQSRVLLRHTARLVSTGYPVFIGASRKSFIGHTLSLLDPDDRLFGSLGAAATAYHGGAGAFRVHDVAAHRQLLDLMYAVRTR